MVRTPSPITDIDAIAERLQFLRVAKGDLPQREFAKNLGIAPTAWNNYEGAVRRISIDAAYKVCVGTGASLDYIYYGNKDALPFKLATDIAGLEQGGRDNQGSRRRA